MSWRAQPPAGEERWQGLRTLLWARLLVAALALPVGLLLGREGAVAASCTGYWALPALSAQLGTPRAAEVATRLPSPGMLFVLLVMVGVLAGTLGRRTQRDREELERAERELDRVRFDNDVILRHLASGVITLDGSGAVAYLNPAAEEVLEIRLRDVRGQSVQQALPERLQGLRSALLAVLEHRSP